jgi:hypothetical protein
MVPAHLTPRPHLHFVSRLITNWRSSLSHHTIQFNFSYPTPIPLFFFKSRRHSSTKPIPLRTYIRHRRFIFTSWSVWVVSELSLLHQMLLAYSLFQPLPTSSMLRHQGKGLRGNYGKLTLLLNHINVLLFSVRVDLALGKVVGSSSGDNQGSPAVPVVVSRVHCTLWCISVVIGRGYLWDQVHQGSPPSMRPSIPPVTTAIQSSWWGFSGVVEFRATLRGASFFWSSSKVGRVVGISVMVLAWRGSWRGSLPERFNL